MCERERDRQADREILHIQIGMNRISQYSEGKRRKNIDIPVHPCCPVPILYILSALFNIISYHFLCETLHDHHTCYLRFEDDIDVIADSNRELRDLTSRLTNNSS